MESNSDKSMRDKLKGHEVPFDPQAWAAMEAMLDKQPKRRTIIWWWVGGIAASLLLGFGAYQLGGGNNNLAQNNRGNSSAREFAQEKNGNAAHNESSAAAVNTTGDNEGSSETGAGVANNAAQQNTPVNNVPANNINNSSVGSNRPGNSNGTAIASNNARKPKSKKKPGYSAAANAGALAQVNNASEQALATNSKTPKKKRPFIKNWNGQTTAIETTAAEASTTNAGMGAEAKKPLEAVNLEQMLADELPVHLQGDINGNRRDGDLLHLKKKKLFHYSMGVVANATGTTISKWQTRNGPGTEKAFHNEVSYAVGFTHDFMLASRFAFSNSIMYSRTSFYINNPRSLTFDPAPQGYYSRITEMAIPVGIKAYPVSKNNFRFYISTGVINHIKFKEVFDYAYPPDYAAIPSLNADNFSFPTQTSFDGSGNGISESKSTAGVIAVRTNTQDFSINKAKRYYASFYAGAGVEGIVKNHLVMFAEPMFYMGLQQIGVQERRKFNVGASAGLRYQF